jgi:hypothetical protein
MTTTLRRDPAPDDDLRTLFEPLAHDEPPPAEFSALRRRAAAARPSRSPARTVAAVAATTAAVGAGIALLPGSSAGPGPEDAAGVLRATAAVAAGRPVPSIAGAPYRYTRTRNTFVYLATEGDRTARLHVEEPGESWVGARWKGRQRIGRGREWTTGDETLARAAFALPSGRTEPHDSAYAYGDGPLAELDPAALPEGRDAIAETLREGIRSNRWSPYPESRGEANSAPGQDRGFSIAYSFVGLLVKARLTPAQRAALLDVLAADPAARDLGTVSDSEGREGRGVALEYGDGRDALDARDLRIVFDPASSEILEWSVMSNVNDPLAPARPDWRRVSGGPDRVETVIEAGYADEIGERP